MRSRSKQRKISDLFHAATRRRQRTTLVNLSTCELVNQRIMSEGLRDKVEEVLRDIYDPEIPVNIVDLGLVYEIKIKENNVWITMTLTAPACPVAGEIVREVQDRVCAIEGVNEAFVQMTFDPPWDRSMMSEEAKLELGFL